MEQDIIGEYPTPKVFRLLLLSAPPLHWKMVEGYNNRFYAHRPMVSGECCFGVMYCEWYGVCDFVVLSVVEHVLTMVV